MTKKELLKALDGLDDDTLIYVQIQSFDESSQIYLINGFSDKVVGKDIQNEITLEAR